LFWIGRFNTDRVLAFREEDRNGEIVKNLSGSFVALLGTILLDLLVATCVMAIEEPNMN